MSKKRLFKFLRYPKGKDRAVTLSFDDGYITDMRFSDKITPAGLKCTFNLASDDVANGSLARNPSPAPKKCHPIGWHFYFTVKYCVK